MHALVHNLAAAPRIAADRSRSGRTRLVTLAVGLILIAVSAAGFARALPDPVQDGFETVVETVSRYEFPGPAAPGSELVPGPRTDLDPAPAGGADRSEISPPRDSSGSATNDPDPETTADPDRSGPDAAGADSGTGSAPGPSPIPTPATDDPADPPPGQDRAGRPGNRPTEVPGQGDERRPGVPPGQQQGAE